MTTEESPTSPTPSSPKPDIYARIVRFAPVYVVVFCIGVLVLVAFLRPFESPASEMTFKNELVGANSNPTGAYFLLHNAGGSDKLLSASSPVATSVVLQVIDPMTTTTTPEGTATGGTYITVDHINVPGFADLTFIPGGNQLLLSGLVTQLSVGQTIPITLQFERAGAITIDAEVQPYSTIADRLLPPRLKLPGE
jgi:copper(I)-binding protein